MVGYRIGTPDPLERTIGRSIAGRKLRMRAPTGEYPCMARCGGCYGHSNRSGCGEAKDDPTPRSFLAVDPETVRAEPLTKLAKLRLVMSVSARQFLLDVLRKYFSRGRGKLLRGEHSFDGRR